MASLTMGHKRPAAVLVMVVMALLSACMLAPGRFTSTLDLRRDGRFTFTYSGEIWMASLSKLAEAGGDKPPAPFVAQPCKDSGGMARPCSPAELAGQKADHEAQAKRAAEREAQDRAMTRAILGGIDPANPQAAEEMAERLRHQAGWRHVEYRGDGVFLVDFAVSGRLDHDFIFPTIERLQGANPFVMLTRRQDGAVRVETPGFSGGPGGMALRQMMMGAAAQGVTGRAGAEMPALPTLDGQFTLTTDGAILANNTEEGPQATSAGQRLQWHVTPQSAVGPIALVRLGGK